MSPHRPISSSHHPELHPIQRTDQPGDHQRQHKQQEKPSGSALGLAARSLVWHQRCFNTP